MQSREKAIAEGKKTKEKRVDFNEPEKKPHGRQRDCLLRSMTSEPQPTTTTSTGGANQPRRRGARNGAPQALGSGGARAVAIWAKPARSDEHGGGWTIRRFRTWSWTEPSRAEETELGASAGQNLADGVRGRLVLRSFCLDPSTRTRKKEALDPPPPQVFYPREEQEGF